MDEIQLQELIDQLREIAPSLRAMSSTAGQAQPSIETDKLIQALARLATSVNNNTKNNTARQRQIDKFVKEVDDGAKAMAQNRSAQEKQRKAIEESERAERQRIINASKTQEARDREAAEAQRKRLAEQNRAAVDELRMQRRQRHGAAELVEEQMRGLTASRMLHDRLEDMAGESTSAQLAVRGLAAAGSGALETLKGFGSGLGSFAGAITSGSRSFNDLVPIIDGVASGLSALADSIPLAGGVLSASIKLVAEGSKFMLNQLEQSVQAFNTVAKAGGLLEDGMTGVYRGFLESGMQLEAYTRTIESNSMALARFGLTVGDGREKFTRFLGTIVDSRAGDELRRIGFTTDQIGETAAAFVTQQTRLGLSQRKTQAQLSMETVRYTRELDLLSKLTGQQREEIINQQDAALSEGRFRATTDRMIAQGNERSAKALLDFQTQVSAISPELGAAVRDTASGFINSENAIKGFNSSGGAIVGIVDALKTGQIDTATALERLQDATQAAESRQRDFASAVGDGQDVFVKYAEISDFNRALVEGSSMRAQAAQDGQTEGTDALTTSTVDAQRNMEQLGRQLNNFGFQVMPQAATAVELFTGALNEFVNYISDELGIALPNITQQLADASATLDRPAVDPASRVSPRPEVTAGAGHARRNQVNRQRAWDAMYGANYNADGTPKQQAEVPIAPGDVPARPGTQQAPIETAPPAEPTTVPTAPTATAPSAQPAAGNVPPRPTQGGHAGRNAKARWDAMYGATHNVDGTPKAVAEAPATTAPPTTTAPPVVAPAPPVVAPAPTTAPPTTTAPPSSAPSSLPSQLPSGSIESNVTSLYNALSEAGFQNEMINASIANVMKESGGRSVSENMNYSSVGRIREVFGRNRTATGARVNDYTDAQLAGLVNNPEALGNFMYGHRMGNEGEGYRFRGRGFIQLTGRNNYAAASEAIFGDDRLVQNPDLAAQPDVASEVTAWFMKTNATRLGNQVGLDATGFMNQNQANLLATSAVAGRMLTPGQSFAGTEGLQRVQQYVPEVANMLNSLLSAPPAMYGGVFKGPRSGYPVQLHGEEAVVPLRGGNIPVDFNYADLMSGDPSQLAGVENSLRTMIDEMKVADDANAQKLQDSISMLGDRLASVLAESSTDNTESLGLLSELVDLTRSSVSINSKAVSLQSA